jgi:S1-C subfamily serine protease
MQTLLNWAKPLMPTALLALVPISLHAQSVPDLPSIVRQVESGVVSIHTFDASGALRGTGSGFVVTGGRLVTNAHVVEGAARVEVFDKENRFLGTTDHAESLSSRVDLAVLPAFPQARNPLTLASMEPSVGASLIVFGAPKGLTNTVSTGIVSAYRDLDGRRWMQLTAPISEGSSGGPVLNAQGQVVGVSVAIYREGQNLNFAVPLHDLAAILSSPPGRFAFSAANTGGATGTVARTPNTPRKAAPQWLPFDEMVEGTFGVNSAVLDSGDVVNYYEFHGRQGQTVSLFYATRDVAPLLMLFFRPDRGEPEVQAYDQDSWPGIGAMITTRLPRTGTYVAALSAAGGRASGEYVLQLVNGPPPPDLMAIGGRWVHAASGDGFEKYVDGESLRRLSAGTYEAWFKIEYANVRRESWGTFNEAKALIQVDCTRRRTQIINQTWYMNGRVVDSYRGTTWHAWVPGSIGESTGQTVCRLGAR